MQKLFILFTGFLLTMNSLQAQKRVSDMVLVYEATIASENTEPKLADAFNGASTTVYIKGNMSRSEMQSALASFTTIHDAKSGSTVVMQEVSGQKLLIRMTADNWKDKNKRYEGITFTHTSEEKMIAGYKCFKAIATLKDGVGFTVYYTKDIVPENLNYNYEFRNLGGLPMEYEMSQGKIKIRYTLSKIDLNPVPSSKFDIPKSGYREMTYEESKKS